MYLGHTNHLSLVYICPILPLEASKTAKTVFSLYDEPIIEAKFSKIERPKKRCSLIKRTKNGLKSGQKHQEMLYLGHTNNLPLGYV